MSDMKVVSRLYFVDDQDEKFFGEGPYRLLKKVDETGSLHSASSSLGMAYSKATRLLKTAEKSLGFPLTVRKIGGKSGGGSVLTDEANDFLRRYEAYRDECMCHNEMLFDKYFSNTKDIEKKFGCVIMASGLGKRFGADKLSAKLMDKPMFQYVVEATEGLFAYRVVVTRNEKVKQWCEQMKIPVEFHNFPGRNDTVRLGLEEIERQSLGEALGCVFCPADMPFINSDSIRNMLLNANDRTDSIIRLSYQGNVGSPVIFGKDYFDELKKLPEGKGGSVIIKSNQDNVIEVEAKSECELWDIDTQEDFEKAEHKMIELKKYKY